MRRKAIALMSGGLDSSLAVRLIHDMGIEIMGVHFTGPFCMCNRGKGGCIHYAKIQAEEMGLSFSTRPLGAEYMEIVTHPKHGRGSGMNPCLDCRILMFRRAGEMMRETGASFIVTGEVLGQRPMSQLRDKLVIIEREAELGGLILRPLSAKHMPETIPEKEGWVDREKLLSIQGRRRREQMDLAESLAIGDYPCPAGGCLLTDKPFSSRLREHLDKEDLTLPAIALLKIGRHFRLPGGSKAVLGRDQSENERLEALAGEHDALLEPMDEVGPSVLVRPEPDDPEQLRIAAQIGASYCDGTGEVTFECRRGSSRTNLTVERRARDCWNDCSIGV